MLAPVCSLQHARQLPATSRPIDKLASLRGKLQRLGGTTTAAAPAPAKGAATSFVTDEERRVLSASQLEFLERKRRAAAGLGPIFPERSSCATCKGTGLTQCHQCGGSGINQEDVAKRLFRDAEEGAIQQNNGLQDMQWFFRENCPCWLCRGDTTIACKDCGATGFNGGMENYVVD